MSLWVIFPDHRAGRPIGSMEGRTMVGERSTEEDLVRDATTTSKVALLQTRLQ